MIHSLFLIIAHFITVLKANPIIGGMVGVYVAAVITFCFRKVPQTISNFIADQLTTRLSIIKSQMFYESMEFISFLEWFQKQNSLKFSRSFSINSTDLYSSDTKLGIGVGKHFFFYKKRLFWVKISTLKSEGSVIEKKEIIINGITRNQQLIFDLFNEFRHKKDENQLYVKCYKNNTWMLYGTILKRDISTVIIDENIKNNILKDIDYFSNNKDWYIQRGLPYKKTYVLHGPPGTGKTSFIKSIASHLSKNVYIINFSRISDDKLEQAIAEVPEGSIILIEDFDTVNAVKNRKQIIENEDEEEQETLSMTTILNVLDGIVSLNGTIVFMTTNHLEDIDPAVIRKGRVDTIFEITYLKDKEIKQYIKLMFPNYIIDNNIIFSDISGCDLQGLFFDSKDDERIFVNSIPKLPNN